MSALAANGGTKRNANHLEPRLGCLLALTLLLAGCGKDAPTAPTQTAATPNDESIQVTEAQLRQIKLATVEEHVFPTGSDAVGKVAYNEDAATPVFSPYTGRVLRLLAAPGNTVKKGQVLFEIDTPDLVQVESDYLATLVGEQKAKVALIKAERTLNRTQRLVAGEAAAAKDLEQAQADYQNAQHDIKTAESLRQASEQRLQNYGFTAQQIEAIRTAQRVERMLTVSSPLAGTVVARKLGVGQYVRPDSPDPLFLVANLDTMWLLAQVYESDIPLVKLGQQVDVRVMAFPNDAFHAKVTYIAPEVDPATRRVGVRAEIHNSGGRLKPEMFANFRIRDTAVKGLAVPDKAVVQEADQRIVWLRESSNRFVRRRVELGVTEDGLVQIQSGLKAGDSVVALGGILLSTVGR